MKKIITDMIKRAEKQQDYELAEYAKRLIDELAETYNAPSNWRYIGEELAEEIDQNSWTYEQLELWNHCD